MENLKEDFLRTYVNIPLNLRDDVIYVLKDGRSISWDVAFFAIKNNSEFSEEILLGLKELKLI